MSTRRKPIIAGLIVGVIALSLIERNPLNVISVGAAQSTPSTLTMPAITPNVPTNMPVLTLPENAPIALVPSEVIATLSATSFLESIAFDTQGNLFATILDPQGGQGEVWKLGVDGKGKTFAKVNAANLAIHPDGTLYATIIAKPTGNPATTEYAVVKFNEDGSYETTATFPTPAQPNGIAFAPDGTLYIADSALGKIWQIMSNTTIAQTWIENADLAPSGPPGIPGGNGLKINKESVYVVNSSTGNFIKFPINPDHTAGSPVTIATGITGDDFAFDTAGSVYFTTHLFNTVVKLSPDGNKAIIGNATNGIVGASAVAFGVLTGDTSNLYVVQDGGLYAKMLPPAFLNAFPETTGKDFAMPSIVKLKISSEGT